MASDHLKKVIEAAAVGQDGGILLVRRWLATWIDFAVLSVGLLILLFTPSTLAGGSNRASDAFVYAIMLAGLILPFAYYIVCETLWGRTLGKLVMGLVVVGEYGEKPRLGPVALRTIARLVEVNPFLIGGLPAGIIVLCSKTHRRLGDMMADTYVFTVKSLKAAKAKDAAIFE